MSQEIRIADIRTDGGTQPRAELNWLVIADYAMDMRLGAVFPPVTVYHDGERYWLASGFHRLHAAKEAGRAVISAEVRQGTQRDAILHSVGENATHGLRRTNADKRRSVETLLRDPEWARWSNREIGRRCGVPESLVRTIRGEMETTARIAQSDIRQGADGRTINTANIGTAPKLPPKPMQPATQAALTDLAFQAPDYASRVQDKWEDEDLAPETVEHAREIITQAQVPASVIEHMMEPGEIIRDKESITAAEVLRGLAQEREASPHAQSLPFGRALIQLEAACRGVEDIHIEAWLSVSTPPWFLCTHTFETVRAFMERAESLMRERQSGGLRVIK